jgi:hypothetical protein
MRLLPTLAFILGAPWFIFVHDPNGTQLAIAVNSILKVRPHPQGGAIIYLPGGAQHVRENYQTVLEMMRERK